MPGAQTSPLRLRIEDVSRPLLVRLTALPRLSVPVLTVVLIAVGLFAPAPVGLLAFAVVVVFLAWIAYLAWPAVTLGGKLMRLAMLALVVALGATRIWPV